jgi:hypothetical protein
VSVRKSKEISVDYLRMVLQIECKIESPYRNKVGWLEHFYKERAFLDSTDA